MALVINIWSRFKRVNHYQKNIREPRTMLGLVEAIAVKLIFNRFLSPTISSALREEKYHYSGKACVMSPAEKEFFTLITQLFGFRYHIFPQVHLGTILNHKITGQNWKGALSHIDRKSIDFVMCDKDALKPLLAIEVDDSSHEREDREIRDGAVESILEEANLQLVRIENHGHFERETVYRNIADRLGIGPKR